MENLNNFIKYLKVEKNYSDYTISNYEIDIIDFLNYCESNHKNYLNISYLEVKPYLLKLYDKDYKGSTISRKISAIRSFYKYLYNNKIIKNNIFRYISLPKKEKKLPKYLTLNEMDELFSTIDVSTPIGIRNRLIVELLYSSGIRVSELTNIKLEDIDFSSNTIKIFGKGKKYRIVCFNKNTKKILDEYLSKRNILLNNKENKYLIVGEYRTNKITTRSIELIIDKVINDASIMKNVSPHTIRHTFATHLLNEGCDILIVKELLGHSSLDTTGIYTHVSNERLRSVYLNTHPRAREKLTKK